MEQTVDVLPVTKDLLTYLKCRGIAMDGLVGGTARPWAQDSSFLSTSRTPGGFFSVLALTTGDVGAVLS